MQIMSRLDPRLQANSNYVQTWSKSYQDLIQIMSRLDHVVSVSCLDPSCPCPDLMQIMSRLYLNHVQTWSKSCPDLIQIMSRLDSTRVQSLSKSCPGLVQIMCRLDLHHVQTWSNVSVSCPDLIQARLNHVQAWAKLVQIMCRLDPM